jgi:catechol 2,3-dioxygenase-like lactoylglutathione lyase family enzyme
LIDQSLEQGGAVMLKDKSSSAIVAVSDIDRARSFYRDTLGLEIVEDDDMVIVFATGQTHLVVYKSDEAGTNRANAVVWDATGDIERIVADLAAKGITFERYDIEGTEYRDGIHHAGDMKMVWFKDPDGNILHINQMPNG